MIRLLVCLVATHVAPVRNSDIFCRLGPFKCEREIAFGSVVTEIIALFVENTFCCAIFFNVLMRLPLITT